MVYQINFCVCVVSKVSSTKKLKQAANLVNGSTEIVKDIIYVEKLNSVQ